MPVLVAAGVLIGGANIAAYAANGQPLLLGHSNSESKTALVHNSGSGPALSLKSKAKSPSLAVSSGKLIKHLNADKIDGLDGSQVKNAAYRYAVPATGPLTSEGVWNFPALPKGQWLASYSLIVFGANTQCFFRQGNPTTAEAFALTGSNTTSGLNASAVVDTTGTHGPVQLHCQGGSYSLYSSAGDAESTVTFTNVGSVTRHTIAPAAPARNAPHTQGRITGNR
jgi:hypothetical protein